MDKSLIQNGLPSNSIECTMQDFKIPDDDAPEAWDHKLNVEVADLAFAKAIDHTIHHRG